MNDTNYSLAGTIVEKMLRDHFYGAVDVKMGV